MYLVSKITEHHPEFWLQVVTDDTDLPSDNIILLTKYIHDILLTAITPYNEHDLFQWYDHNREQLHQQFAEAAITDTKRIERQRQATELGHRQRESELLTLETTRIENQKANIRSATAKRLEKERSAIARNLPQKQSRTAHQRTHRELQAELHLQVEQHARSVAMQTKQKEEQRLLAHHQALKQLQDNQELLIRRESEDRKDIIETRFGTPDLASKS